MSTNMLDEISKVLKGIERYWVNEKLAKQVIIEDLRNNNIHLISKLLSNEDINSAYTQNIDDYKIFDKDALISMLRYKNYWQDSYTKYTNKIGLTTEGQYLNYTSDVILDFPFKDCVLEGKMTKEESILKNDEKFYNQVIAKDEIDTLLSPKIFTKIRKYDQNGEHKIVEFSRNDNLIIKANNLITLHSLKYNYSGKIKLIYIDPPYNTGGDGFDYNDKFNHSSWLTFIKNRLEVSKELLSDDGAIFINIDDDESHYLKVLADEIFGRNNFINNIIWQKKYAPQNDSKYFTDNHDHIIVYAKNKENWSINPLPRTEKQTKYYKHDDNDGRGLWRTDNVLVKSFTKDRVFPVINPNTQKEYYPPEGRCWRYSKETFNKMIEENKIYWGKNGNGAPQVKRYLNEVKQGVTPLTIWSRDEVGDNQEGKKEINTFKFKFETPKPERLIQRIIHIATNERDIVLDFFMGSATTQAVAHKMNRQYIGVEQMDYINTVSVPRLEKVIEGEQGGISKDIDWQGGGSFVYLELAKENQKIVDRIISSNTKEELSQQINNLLDNGVLNYEVDFNEFTNTNKEFNELKLEEQKEVLIRILDSNQLYINYSDIEDTAYNFSEDEIAFNHSFYGGE
ncbi:site-specific DNA-methyltransferase [Staphylococcus borealis]|uniref:site-specific DNA-methyltransferase n=1 Tax=Staphylococcus borealis TaxID=2742203 RepID=UPI0025A00B87|nr:site-specific DNA-methyltransferase [Staphylococcus borealis]MDM7862586.1 site-specific DNA-methyltransferase [Staphylococcus borealis]